jgi:hypothetical protein
MDEDVKGGFQYLRQQKCELDALVIGRNELAKWYKLNSNSYEFNKINFGSKKK